MSHKLVAHCVNCGWRTVEECCEGHKSGRVLLSRHYDEHMDEGAPPEPGGKRHGHKPRTCPDCGEGNTVRLLVGAEIEEGA